MIEESPRLATGSLLDGRFSLQRRLGKGGYGDVWLATDGSDLRPKVAVKILHPHLQEKEAALKALAKEAEVLAALDHPNIARPLTFNVSNGAGYIAMEYVDGLALSHEMGARARSKRPFTRDELVRVFTELCWAIGYAHAEGIIHRDLKPQNVMIVRRAGVPFVKVVDFGLAKLFEAEEPGSRTRVGSKFYMAPETALGNRVGPASDIFSLGSILFEISTLKRAWARNDTGKVVGTFTSPLRFGETNGVVEVMRRVFASRRPHICSIRPELPGELDDVVKKAVAVKPKDRYQTVDQMVEDFRSALEIPRLCGPDPFMPALRRVSSVCDHDGDTENPFLSLLVEELAAAPRASSSC